MGLIATAVVCLLAFAAAVTLGRRNFRIVRVVGDSMEPTLHAGDLVLIRLSRSIPAVGRMVVFSTGVTGEFLIKRAVEQPPRQTALGAEFEPHSDQSVDSAAYFIGDRRPSIGQRLVYGPVVAERILGAVVFRIPIL